MHYRSLPVAAALFLLAGCGPTPVSEVPRCLKLAEPDGSSGLLTGLPAKVSLFFGVTTCEGQPVSGLSADAFDVQEDGKGLSAYESQRTIQPRGQRFRMSSLLLLDLSGSVLKGGQFPSLKAGAQAYAKTVLDQAADGQRVAVMTFDGRAKPQLLVDFTSDLGAVMTGLASLETRECTVNADCAANADHQTCSAWRCVDDSTNLNGAVVQGLDVLDAQVAREPDVTWRDGALVVFTDGADEASRVTQEAALTRVNASKTHVFTVGLGADADVAALSAFGRDGYFPAAAAEQLSEAFRSIAQRVTAMANRFYLLEYCSPKRNGTHSLKLTATLSDGTAVPLVGSLSRDFDATGFTSGCSLGN